MRYPPIDCGYIFGRRTDHLGHYVRGTGRPTETLEVGIHFSFCWTQSSPNPYVVVILLLQGLSAEPLQPLTLALMSLVLFYP